MRFCFIIIYRQVIGGCAESSSREWASGENGCWCRWREWQYLSTAGLPGSFTPGKEHHNVSLSSLKQTRTKEHWWLVRINSNIKQTISINQCLLNTPQRLLRINALFIQHASSHSKWSEYTSSCPSGISFFWFKMASNRDRNVPTHHPQRKVEILPLLCLLIWLGGLHFLAVNALALTLHRQ